MSTSTDSVASILDKLRNKYRDNSTNADGVSSLVWERVPVDELLELAEALHRQGVTTSGLLGVAGGDSDSDSNSDDDSITDDDEENAGEDSGDDDAALLEADPVMYQFGLEEEEELEDEMEESDELNFESLQEGNPFENSIRLLDRIEARIDSLDSTEKLLQLSRVHCLYGNNYLELDDFDSAIDSYKKGVHLLESWENNYSASEGKTKEEEEDEEEKDEINQAILKLYTKLVEALKWTDDVENYSHYLKRTIELLEERLSNEKKLLTSERTTLQKLKSELKAELKDVVRNGSHRADIRAKHPEFDAVLKRALGKLLSPEEIERDYSRTGMGVNDLSSMVKRRKKR